MASRSPRSARKSPTSGALREQLVGQLERKRAIRTTRVRRAFLRIPREMFVPGFAREKGLSEVYKDQVVVLKMDARGIGVSSSSQPGIMAPMLEQLDLRPGHRVLEIGAGSGYNAALMSAIVGPRGRVTSVELDPRLAHTARAALRRGRHRARVVVGDGRKGWPAGAPYDRIIATASSTTIPRAWFDQLTDGGILELPIRLSEEMPWQLVVALRKESDTLRSVGTVPGGFMPLRARAADPNPEAGLPQTRLAAYEWQDTSSRMLAYLAGRRLRALGREGRRRAVATLLGRPRVSRLRTRTGPVGTTVWLALSRAPGFVIATYSGGGRHGSAFVGPRR